MVRSRREAADADMHEGMEEWLYSVQGPTRRARSMAANGSQT